MLTESQLHRFRQDGYLPVGPVVAGHDLADLRAMASRLVGPPGLESVTPLPESHLIRSDPTNGEVSGHIRVVLHLCHLSGLLKAHALNRVVVSAVRSLFGEEPVVLTSLLFHKPARIGQPLLFHQDLPYYPYLGEEDLVTCWVAIDETSPDNGYVEYMPGSHRRRLPHREAPGQPLQLDAAQLGASTPVPVPLRPGEAVLHHGLTVHRSDANRSGQRRLGLATLYIRESAQVSPDDFPYPLLAVGR